MDVRSDLCMTLQEALLGERGKLLEALQREEAHAAAVAVACKGAGMSTDPAEGDPGADPAAPADAGPSAGDGASGSMAVDEAAVEGAAEQGGGAAGDGIGQAAEGDADALDAYMSSVRTQIELEKARHGSMRYTLNPIQSLISIYGMSCACTPCWTSCTLFCALSDASGETRWETAAFASGYPCDLG